mmetsp:Transcript_5243/g.8793  ORF Transcript_5243/g.8793 Transcript_5243/m.8793 type:complete len:81 (+) Transcript_5243:425-667(+)
MEVLSKSEIRDLRNIIKQEMRGNKLRMIGRDLRNTLKASLTKREITAMQSHIQREVNAAALKQKEIVYKSVHEASHGIGA